MTSQILQCINLDERSNVILASAELSPGNHVLKTKEVAMSNASNTLSDNLKEQWHAIRREAALKIDADTAEVC